MIPETLESGASKTCKQCKTTVELMICTSAAGFYIGTYCKCGPYTRESEYYKRQDDLYLEFKAGTWKRRYDL